MNAYEKLQNMLKKAEGITDIKRREFIIAEARKEYANQTTSLEESGAIVDISNGEIAFNLSDMKAYTKVEDRVIQWNVTYAPTFTITGDDGTVVNYDTTGVEVVLTGTHLEGVSFDSYDVEGIEISNVIVSPISSTQIKLTFNTGSNTGADAVYFILIKAGYKATYGMSVYV